MIYVSFSRDMQTAPAAKPTSAADDRATEFKAVEGSPTETYSGAKLMVGAYAAIWALMMLWILLLWSKQSQLTARLDGLERAIDRAAANADKKKTKSAKPPGKLVESADPPAQKAAASEPEKAG
jgi:hypothetical protein